MGGGRAYRVWHTGQARMCVCVREREVADVARMEVGGRAWESVQAHPRVPCDAEQLAWLRLRHARRQRVHDRLLTHGGTTEMSLSGVSRIVQPGFTYCNIILFFLQVFLSFFQVSPSRCSSIISPCLLSPPRRIRSKPAPSYTLNASRFS